MGEVIEQAGDLFGFFLKKKLIVHRALRVYHFGRVALVGFESASLWESCTCERKKFWFGSVCFVSGSRFSSFSFHFQHDCVERYLCPLRSHVLAFDRLCRAVTLVLGNRSALE